MYQYLRITSGINSSQSMLYSQSSCISNVGISVAVEMTPNGSNMLLGEYSISRFLGIGVPLCVLIDF